MIDHVQVQLALRARALTLEVAATDATVTPVLDSVTVGDAAWTATGTPTRTPAALTAGDGVPIDLIGDDSAGTEEAYSRAVTFAGNGQKPVSVRLSAGPIAPGVGTDFSIFDSTAGLYRVLARFTWSAGVPSVAMTNGTLVTTENVGNGVYEFEFLSSAVTAASAHQLIIAPSVNAGGTGNVYAGSVKVWDAALSATATGYARTSGSFYTDAFWPGMELLASGFTQAANNGTKVITAVTPTTISCAGCAVEAAGAGRALTVGLPSKRAWENTTFVKTTGVPWVEEQYIPGPSAQVTLGPLGEIEILPLYALLAHLPTNTGLTPARYTDALVRHFPPRLALPLANGDVLRIRSDVGPIVGQLQQSEPGFSVKPVTFAGRLRTANSI